MIWERIVGVGVDRWIPSTGFLELPVARDLDVAPCNIDDVGVMESSRSFVYAVDEKKLPDSAAREETNLES